MKSTRALLFTVPMLVLAMVAGSFSLALSKSGPPAPQDVLADALKLAGQQPSFHMVADMEQTVIPRALPGNGGKGDETTTLRVVGDLARQMGLDGTMEPRARLQFYAGTESPVEFILAGTQTYVGYGSHWQQVDAPPGGIAPGGDYLGYLVAATDVTEGDPVDTAAGTLRRYTFNFDGQRYAEFQRDEALQSLAGQLPPGVQLQLHPVLAASTGQGELWIDNNGLPRRQIMDLHLPGVTAGYDAQMHLTVDFSRYGDPTQAIALPQPTGAGGALVMPAVAPPYDSPGPETTSATIVPAVPEPVRTALSSLVQPLRRGATTALVVLPVLMLVVLLVTRQRRSLYVAVVSALILIMVAQPLLEAGRVVRFSKRTAEAAPLADALSSLGASDSARSAAMPAADQLAQLPGADDASLKDCHVLFTDAGYSPSGDEDGDGLDNETEWCLGTDFRNPDSDSDSITDTVEVEGFVYDNQTWFGNPLESDTNRDGASDGAEWPVDLTGSDFEDVVDYDNDGVPNLWDSDNDGDGVPDDQDISIYSVTAYRTSFDLEVTSHSTGTYVYVDLQMQPQASSHLRYNLSTLDWPADDLGQIQDLDNSAQDITLVPYLDIDSPISPTLSSEYGIASYLAPGNNPDGQYQLLVPLQPVLDRGDVHAFSARLVFTSNEADDGIALRNGRIVWMVEGVLDQYVTSCQAGDAGCTCAEGDDTSCVLAQNSLLTKYPEEYLRLTGLQFSESMNVTTGVFGTGTNLPQVSGDPNQDDEDKVMMSLMSAGLAGSFLGFQHPNLDEIAANFGDPAAQPPFTPTWGINPVVMQVVTGTYAHRDEAMATTTQTTTVSFLEQNYVDCTVNTTNQLTPTLALAYEETSASMSFSDPHLTIVNNDSGVASSAPLQIAAPLADMPLGVTRYTQLQSYGCAMDDSGQASWQVLSLGDGLAEVNRRYADDFNQPWFGAVQQMFMVNYQGRANYITVGDVLMPDVGETAAASDFAALVDDQTTTMPDYVRAVYQLDPLTLKIDELGLANGYWDWSSSLGQQQNKAYYWGSASVLALKIVGAFARHLGYGIVNRNPPIRVVQVAADDLTVPQVQKFADRYFNGDAEALVADFDSDVPASAFIRQVKDQGYFEIPEVDHRAWGRTQIETYNNIGKGTAALGALAYVTAEVAIWLQYAASIRGATSIQQEVALSQAVSATILLTVQVLISIVRFLITWFRSVWAGLNNSVDLLVLLIIYIIVAAISHDWNPAHTTDELAKLILNINVLAKIPDGGINTGPLNMRIEPGSSGIDGPLAGNWYNITTTISTTVQLNPATQEESWYKNTDVGSSDDVKKSWAYVRWSALAQSSPQYPTYLESYLITNTLPVFGADGAGANTHCYAGGQVVSDSSVFTGTEKDCVNDVSLAFKPTDAGRNAAAPFQNTIEQNMRYQKCWWDVVGYTCSYDMNYETGPDNPVVSTFYIDALPGSLDSLIGWDAYNPVSDTTYADFNPDLDSDGLLNSQETADCTNGLPPGATSTCPDNWDSDGDGLGDGWETDQSTKYSTDPLQADIDGDGLNDRFEVSIGTSVVISDTDGDGLLDGEEFCRYEDGVFKGGWIATEAGGYRVCSDPLKVDADGDGLLDRDEMLAGLSPYAPNRAPQFRLNTFPSTFLSGGLVSVLGAADPLTVTVYVNNILTTTVDQPLTLDYAVEALTTPAVVTQVGSTGYAPPTPGETGSGLSWNLSANPLYAVEAMTSTLLTGANPALTQSQVTTLTATLVYSDAVAGETRTLSQTIPVLVDLDEPSSAVTSPADGEAVNGTAYVVGGTASDPTSWPRLVEARATGSGYDTGWQAAGGTTTWAWTWTPLPADGLYTVQSRATDYVFNVQSTPTTSSVIVDNTAPGAAFSNLQTGDALQITGNTVTVAGTATDLLSGAAQVAGLQTVQLSIDGRPWRNVDEYLSAPHPATADWQFSWTVDAAAYGSHTLQVRAVDALGQIGDPTEITVVIDTLPPTDIWSNYAPYLPAGQSVALLGHADDEGNVPLPARPQALENSLDAVLSSTVRLMPEAYTDTVGMTVTWLGDVNGDARADLAVGMPAATVDGMSGAGRVSVVYGQPGGWPVPPQSVALPDATTSFVGSSDNAQLGQVVGPAGDVNSDGLSDILVGDPAANRVYVVYGSAGGVGQDFNLSTLATGQNGHLGRTYTSSLGQVGTWASAAGDVNGDGFDDILVGVTGLSGGSAALYLLPGGPATGTAGLIDVSSAALETFQLDNTGAAATGVGDVNDDQYGDFVLADPNGSFGGGPAVYLFLGPPAWRQPGETGPLNPATHANASFAGQSGVGSQVVALGDVDGDPLGLPDFAYSDGTTPRVVYGRTSGWTTGMAPSVTFSGSTAFDSFISAPGDVNADGVNDVLLGSSSAGGSAFLYHGRPDLATNQPVQAEIGGVAAAASAPYAAGADLNCDLSSDLLVVPVGEMLTVESADGSLEVRDQRLASREQGQWIGPAAAPFDLRDLPEAGSLSPARASYAAGRAADVSASLTTPALAFRVVGDNIDDWATDAAMVGDFDGDGKTDIAGWSNTTATNEPVLDGDAAAEASLSEDVAARQAATDTTPLENTLDIQEAEAPAAGWRIWHSDGYSATLSFTEYSNNLPAAVSGSTARLVADFDGDQKTDIGYWDGSQWQFVRSDGASGSAFSFTAVSSNLGGIAGGDTGQMLTGDFDGDGSSDIAAWDGSAWATYVSQASGTTFDFSLVSNNLGALSGSDASRLVVGDFDSDGTTDVASRPSDSANWTVWLSSGLAGGALTFSEVTATSLGYALTSAVPRLTADFSGDGKSDVLALFDNTDFYAWLSQAEPGSGTAPFRRVLANALQFSGSFPTDTLVGDFDGDSVADYVSPDAAGTGWTFQLSGLAMTRVVDDDFCETCANDGLVWGETAFADLQPALDATWNSDILLVQPGTYSPAVVNAGRDHMVIRGSDPDAVFLDAGGGAGISLLPTPSQTYPNLAGVTIENLTIRNASTGIAVNFGGDAASSPGENDPDNVVIRNVLVYADLPGSTALDLTTSAVRLSHTTLIANAPGVTLIHSTPEALAANAVFVQDTLFVALPNAAPLPAWWSDASGNPGPTLNSHSGFASQNGAAGDWRVAPAGNPATLMTVTEADFLNVVEQVFRIGAGSAARGLASDGTDLGYYTYRDPVTVDATYCPSCDNDGLTWGVDAFTSIQDGVNSGAQRVLIDPGLYRERVALVNGVSLFGSGAGLTVLAPPDPDGGFLLGAENARLAAVALLTIAGEGTSDGIQVDGRGSLTLKRAVVRNTGTAISVSGDEAVVTLVNDTIVSNEDGVVATNCGSVDVRNTILAYHQDTALAVETCATTSLHTFNAFWQNGQDLQIDGAPVDQPGPGEVFADPRFTDASSHDYRPQANSPVVDAGDPSDPAPPGSGERVDMGYAQSVEAAVYASQGYCAQCLNDGLEWQVTAFDAIQDAVDHVPDIAGVWTVGVDSGVYHEQLSLPSGVRLIGAGAETTVIDGDATGSTVTIDGATNVQITGFAITNGGENPTDAGIAVDGASSNIRISRNLVGGISPDNPGLPGNGNAGVIFRNGSSGQLTSNTLALNAGPGVLVEDSGSWLLARFNIVALNDIGLDNAGGLIFHAYNLVYNSDPTWCTTCQNYVGGLTVGVGEINADPLFRDAGAGDLRLTLASPAIDAIPASQFQPIPNGGGTMADMGYAELLAMPATLLLGKEGNSCGLGASGVAAVEVGLVYVPDANVSADETPPASWQNAMLATAGEAGSYWTAAVTPSSGDGLYRLYSRPADQVGNQSSQVSDWYRAAFIADGTAPAVTLVAPTQGMTSTAPAVTLAADVSDWTPTGLPGQSSFTVDAVTFLVDSAVVTATRALTTASPGEAQLYTAQVALGNGTHTVSALATDLAGNVGQSNAVSLTVVTTQNEAALADPAPGSAVNAPAITLSGYVHFQDTAGSGQVEVLVDGVSQGNATLADPAAQATRWSKAVTLADDGSHTLTLRAGRSAGTSAAADSTATLLLDTAGPEVTFDPPTGTVTRTVTLVGTASDPSSGLASVSVSLDGGHSYQDATVDSSGDWTFPWTPDLGNDYAGFPVRVRALDSAGNVTVDSATVVVDNLGPTPISLASASPQEGSHIDAPSTVQLDWLPATDGSGTVTVYAAVDQITGTVPAQTSPIPGASYAAEIPGDGTWYVHLLAVDGTGNRTVRHFGPWFAETGSVGVPGPPGMWQSSVQVNGYLDFANGEWEPDTELLGSDPRPGQAVSLYATWDSDDLFLAWQGAHWGPDGTGVVHLDTEAGGTTTPYGGATTTLPELPFAADFAVVSGPGTEQLLAWNGGGWQPLDDPGFAAVFGATGATEIRIPRAAVNATGVVRLLALNLDDGGAARSLLPDVNPLAGPWTAAYQWPGLLQDIAPNAGQPDAHHARVTISSPDNLGQIPGPGSVLRYVFDVSNIDDSALDRTTLVASGSDGLRFESLAGWPPPGDASSPQAPADDRWFIDLGALQPNARLTLTITARVKQDIAGTDAVTVTAELRAGVAPGEPDLASDILSHAVDGRPPAVRIDLPQTGATLPSGPQTISGSASDHGGGGVASVEVRVDDGPWIAASGARTWSAQIDVPASGQFTLRARAFDVYGYAGEADSVAVAVDNEAPAASIDATPPVLGGARFRLTGTAADPAGGAVARVEIQVDGGPWQRVLPPYTDAGGGAVAWTYGWSLPTGEGVEHTLRARATDQAGNTGPASAATTVTVDTVAPTSTIVYPQQGALLDDRTVLVWGLADDGWAVDRVDVSLDGGTTWDAALLGDAARDLLDGLGVPAVPPDDHVWAVQLEANSFHLAIRSRAADPAGNTEPLRAPVRATVEHVRYWLPLMLEQ